MARALALAERGLFTTTPNPRVGCVIARGGEIIGEGWHERAGGPHAEVAALADARARGHDPAGATLYCTLEPCAHSGRTPPCTDAIVAARVARVVAAMGDPNPEAAHGAQALRAAGIAVDVGLMEREARSLNCGFVSRVTRGRPWVRMKVAASLDGRTALADGASRWITGAEARADGHAFRARACAIVTGIGTVLADDPELTVRAVATTRQPLRVVVDRRGQTPPHAKVLRGGALVVTADARPAAWPAIVEHLALPDAKGRVDLGTLLRALAARGCNEAHVEAGARLNAALLEAGLVDEVLAYVAPSLIGDPARGVAQRRDPLASLDARVRLAFDDVARVGDDIRIRARILGRN
ncbi:MAG: bifunctional diaminohydroxyphosphoribosylaminopyrimidine deaminase/5-amino-6-(5-phosphoribosylamino)uracil reductase RibD [Betaproteobacteria bacterium]|nr:bifunctional diaminohydroxyphosphoribosylaminopyrimidine deaminase/5-amino-6-(5-phosphoribosylamino)uracil reductase RibD [Betaproteobacteria bacterium]